MTATRLPLISPAAWEHPTDRAALNALKKIPGFDAIIRRIIGMFGERGIRLMYQANAIKVGPNQYPELHAALLRVCDILDADEVPELYLSQAPHANAGAVGVDHPFIVLQGGLVETADPRQVEAVIGHEVGHVVSEHALYRTVLQLLLGLARQRSPLISAATLPIVLALLEWSRKAELSCDRAGLLAVQELDASLGVLAVLAGGVRGRSSDINLDEFIAQSDEYMDESGLATYYKTMSMLGRTHPHAVVRVAELRRWVDAGDYDRIIAGEYVRRGDEAPLADDARETFQSYSRGVQRTLNNVGDRASTALNDLADKLDGFIGGRGVDNRDAPGAADAAAGEGGDDDDPLHDWDPWEDFF